MKKLALIAAAALLLGALGPADAKPKNEVALKVAPDFHERKLTRIGILPAVFPSMEDDRVEMVRDMAQAEFQEQGEFVLLFPEDLQSAATRAGHKDAYDTLIRVWRARRELDPPALATLAESFGVDAIAGAELTHWEQRKLEFTEEGNSTTTVGLHVWLWDARDRTLLWEASQVKVAKSPPYNPSGSVVSDAGGGARQGFNAVPEPPEFDDVAEEVVKNVIGTYPKPGDPVGGDKKKSKKKGDKPKTENEETGR